MPLELSTSWLTVPDGFTQVIAADMLMSNRLHQRSVSRIASPFMSLSHFFILSLTLFRTGWSMIPVNETPSKRSSSQLVFHSGRRYGKLVKEACQAPNIAAILTLAFRSSSLSLGRTTTSERLQNWLGRSRISMHGLPPTSSHA